MIRLSLVLALFAGLSGTAAVAQAPAEEKSSILNLLLPVILDTKPPPAVPTYTISHGTTSGGRDYIDFTFADDENTEWRKVYRDWIYDLSPFVGDDLPDTDPPTLLGQFNHNVSTIRVYADAFDTDKLVYFTGGNSDGESERSYYFDPNAFGLKAGYRACPRDDQKTFIDGFFRYDHDASPGLDSFWSNVFTYYVEQTSYVKFSYNADIPIRVALWKGPVCEAGVQVLDQDDDLNSSGIVSAVVPAGEFFVTVQDEFDSNRFSKTYPWSIEILPPGAAP